MEQCIEQEDVKQIYESLSPEAKEALDSVIRCLRNNLEQAKLSNQSPNSLMRSTGFGELSGAELIMVLIERGFLDKILPR